MNIEHIKKAGHTSHQGPWVFFGTRIQSNGVGCREPYISHFYD